MSERARGGGGGREERKIMKYKKTEEEGPKESKTGSKTEAEGHALWYALTCIAIMQPIHYS